MPCPPHSSWFYLPNNTWWCHFSVPGSFCQRIRPGPRLSFLFRNKLGVLWWWVVSPRPTPKLEDHPLSAVRDCLFNICPATLHIWRPSPPSANLGHAMPWWQANHLTWCLLIWRWQCSGISGMLRHVLL
jgi:hypothetical protein